MWTPCDEVQENGQHKCPYADTYAGYADEMCRVCCGLGVDDDEYPEEEDYPEEEEYWIPDDDYSSNCSCDTSGICGGPSCPQYYDCVA